LNETLEYLQTFTRFPFALRHYLKRAPSEPEVRATVGERLAQRKSSFLRILEHSVYGWPRSPYRALLEIAGCKLGDVQAPVCQHGLEGALRARFGGSPLDYQSLQVRRQRPTATSRDKLLPLHIRRGPARPRQERQGG
jgi:hypothetical protein